MKRLVFVLALFVAFSANAATRHVFQNSSGGGSQLNDCANTAHSANGTSGRAELTYCAGALLANALNRIICDGTACSTDAQTNCCRSWTTTTAQCTSIANLGTVTAVSDGAPLVLSAGNVIAYDDPQSAITAASSGDTIKVHTGTYSASSSPSIDGSGTYSLSVNKTNLTIQRETGDTPVIDGGGSVNGCVAVTSTGNGLVLDGLTCDNHICSSAGNRVGIIYMVDAVGVDIRNMTIEVTGSTSDTEEYRCGAFRMRAATDDVLIENNTVSGNFEHGALLDILTGTAGYVIRNNTFNLDGTGANSNTGNRIFLIKQVTAAATGNIAIYNNRSSSAGPQTRNFAYLRENSGTAKLYMFNNIATGIKNYAVYAQEDSCPATPYCYYYGQNVWVFNNTIVGPFTVVRWPDYFSVMRVFNNIVTMDNNSSNVGVVGSNAPVQLSGCASCPHGTAVDTIYTSATDKFTTNLLEYSYGLLSGSPGVSTIGTIQSTGTLTSRNATTQYLTDSTSPAGNNDPLSTGTAGLCLITAAGQTIDCSLDINGTDRGTAWDIGADQFLAASAVCGNGSVEGAEVCDDGNTTTETVCDYNEPGGTCTACNSACSAVLNLTGPYCGDSLLGTLYGEVCDTGASYVLTQTCVGLGFAGGTLLCATDCQSYNTSGCSLTATEKTLHGATLSGGKVQ